MADEEFGKDDVSQSNQSTVYEEGDYEIIEGENGESELDEISHWESRAEEVKESKANAISENT